MILAPCTRAEANAFVDLYHRHNGPVVSDLFRVALEVRGGVVAIGIAGLPKARMLCDGRTIEVTRITARGEPNACTRLYGALCDAARALGYWRAVTYTRQRPQGGAPRALAQADRRRPADVQPG